MIEGAKQKQSYMTVTGGNALLMQLPIHSYLSISIRRLSPKASSRYGRLLLSFFGSFGTNVALLCTTTAFFSQVSHTA